MRRLLPFLAPLALLGLVAASALSGPDYAGDQVPDYAAEGYAGHASCRPCHVELYDRWAASAHARSTMPLTPENAPPEMLEAAVADHAPGSTRFSREGDRFFAHTLGPDGEVRRYPVTHVVGPERMSFFLTRMEDGRLQVLPSMREIPTGVWFDYTHLIFGVPGLDYATPPVVNPGEPSFWTGPIRSYDRTCGRCHSSGRRVPVPDGRGGTRYEWDPLEVDCEACHGPSAAHVEFWKHPPERWRRDPLPDLKAIGRERAQSVCLWCHMEAEVVDQHWRPGDDVFEYLTPTMLDDIERIDAAGRPLELIYDGLPFLYSRCAEEGGLTCISCHDAHGSPHTADLVTPPDRTFTLCTGCHREYGADARAHTHHDMTRSGGRCVSCHMPYLTIERGHGVVRDHTLGSPMLDLAGGRVAVDACTWCHTGARGAPDDAPILSPEEIRRSFVEWYPDAGLRPGWVAAMAGGRDRRPEAFFELVRVAGALDLPPAVRASAAKLLQGYPDRALPYLMNLLDDDRSLVRRAAAAALAPIRHPDADLALAAALEDPSRAVRGEAARAALAGWSRVQENPGLLAAAIPVLEEEARAVPQEDTRWFRLGAAHQIAGNLEEAVRAYERKVSLDPYATLVRQTLAELRALLEER